MAITSKHKCGGSKSLADSRGSICLIITSMDDSRVKCLCITSMDRRKGSRGNVITSRNEDGRNGDLAITGVDGG